MHHLKDKVFTGSDMQPFTLPNQLWSVVSGNKEEVPDLSPITCCFRSKETAEGISADIQNTMLGGRGVMIWRPKSHADFRPHHGLSWGLTAFIVDGSIVSYQRVVFIEEHVEVAFLGEHGSFHLVRTISVSAWDGAELEASMADPPSAIDYTGLFPNAEAILA